MIKFTATTADGRKLLGLGLSHENLERLKNNQTIRFKGEPLGMRGVDILIFAGKTEASMSEELDPAITLKTIIRDKTT